MKRGTFSCPSITTALTNLLPDIRTAAWQQKGHLIKQIFTQSSLFKDKKRIKPGKDTPHERPTISHPIAISPSRLRYTVDPPTPQEDTPPLFRPATRTDAPSSSTTLVRSRSNRSQSEAISTLSSTPPRKRIGEMNGAIVYGSPETDTSRFVEDDMGGEDDDTLIEGSPEHEHGGKMKGAMKGFLGKLRHRQHHLSRHENGSTDEVSRVNSDFLRGFRC
jgi:hypothetical protein